MTVPHELAEVPDDLINQTSQSQSNSSQHEQHTTDSNRESDKVIAASLGALLTGLTMTPFDVIKTRLQTQNPPDPLFVPASRLPSTPSNQVLTTTTTTTTSSIPSSSASSTTLKTSHIPTPRPNARPSTCCQRTFFNNNSGSIICRFDPRIAANLPISSGYHRSTKVQIPLGIPSSSAVTLECQYPSKSIAITELSRPHATARFTGFWDAVIKIISQEGASTLWRGVGPTLAISVPSQVGYMIGYDNLRRYLLTKQPFDAESSASTMYIACTTLFSGSVTRAAVVSFFSPVELLRTRMQSIPAGPDTTMLNIIKSTWHVTRSQGYTSLWRGLPPTLWRDVPFSGIYWASYEAVKRSLVGRGMGETSQHEDGKGKTFTTAFISGVLGSSVAATITHPFDVIKTRRQVSAMNDHGNSVRTSDLVKSTIRNEGVKSLFAGLTPRLAKVMPACGIMIGVYELGLSKKT